MNSAEKRTAYTAEWTRFDRDVPTIEKKAAREIPVRTVALAGRQRVQAFVLLVLCGFLFIGLIGVNAFSSKLQYDINTLNRQILSVERAVQNLEVEIQTATSIATVEAKAMALGMVYPTFQEMVYLDGQAGVQEDFALALRESAYE